MLPDKISENSSKYMEIIEDEIVNYDDDLMENDSEFLKDEIIEEMRKNYYDNI